MMMLLNSINFFSWIWWHHLINLFTQIYSGLLHVQTGGQCFKLSPARHIPIPGEDESQWSKHPYWEWDVPHWECISSQGMGMHLTRNAHSLYNYKVKLSWIAFWFCGYFEVGCYKICSVQEQSLWGKPHFYVKIQIFTVGIFKLCSHTDLWQSKSGR